MSESPSPSHPQPSSSSSGTAFVRSFLGAVTDDARNSSAAYPSPNFTELNRTLTCMVLEANANDRRTSSPLPI
ncbi:hypothetical protein TNCV_2521591 [Trichonephila clavipes]|nr:hypothetical protein TNCV_2521591 [Trichonephila clavipes]